jgi:hypothetical protein
MFGFGVGADGFVGDVAGATYVFNALSTTLASSVFRHSSPYRFFTVAFQPPDSQKLSPRSRLGTG